VSKPISQNVPDAEKLISMKSEELAGYLLEHLHSNIENRRHRFQPDNLAIEISRGAYPSNYEEKISEAVRKGYQWLKNRDYIYDRTSNGFFDFTEKGEEIKTAEELFNSLRSHQMSKSSLPTQLMSDKEGADTPAIVAASINQNFNDGPVLNNRYRILSPFPSSGFGQTFLAEDVFLPSRRKCVIKRFDFTSTNPETYHLMLERFEREAINLEKLAELSEQIPSLYAHFAEQGQYYLVQEWVNGETVAAKVAKSGPFNEANVKNLLRSILLVLKYVHSHGIIHRDIKPENIILREGDGKPFLIDFGAIKEMVRTVCDPFGNPSTTIVIGTQGFMPTEQAAGRPVFASDLYCLGLTAIYMLTGKRPPDLTDLRSGDISWRDKGKDVSAELAAIIDKSINHDFRERFPDALEMLNALDAISQDTVVEAQDEAIKGIRLLTKPQAFESTDNIKRYLRPMVTARVTTHSAGNVATAFNLLVHNSGNSPAKNVKLTADGEDLESAFSDTVSQKWKDLIRRCFSDEGAIPVLANGESKTNSFGAFSTDPDNTTWKIGSIINVIVTYEDLDGTQYSHDISLKIVDDKGFAGAFWEKEEKPSKARDTANTESEAARRRRVRVLLSQEIGYNIKYLTGIYESVNDEQTKNSETVKTDGYGNTSSEGYPIKALMGFHPDTLSQRAWESQIEQAPSALNLEELEAVFGFYGDLNGIVRAQERFLNAPNVSDFLDEVMRRIEAILGNYPELL
jgi:serine/threonine protein kinase